MKKISKIIKSGKGKFFYSAVTNHRDCSKYYLHCIPWQTYSIEHHFGFSGEHSAKL